MLCMVSKRLMNHVLMPVIQIHFDLIHQSMTSVEKVFKKVLPR